MKTQVLGRGLELSAPLTQHIDNRLAQWGDRYLFMLEAHVVVEKQRGWYTCEVTLHAKHQLLRSEERSNDLASSIDTALDKLERQLDRHKSRLLRRSKARDSREAPPLTSYEPETPEEEYQAPRVVKVKKIAIKPMSVEEAALQMELLGHDFYVFTDDESSEMNVIYKRRNGDIGLIQPGE